MPGTDTRAQDAGGEDHDGIEEGKAIEEPGTAAADAHGSLAPVPTGQALARRPSADFAARIGSFFLLSDVPDPKSLGGELLVALKADSRVVNAKHISVPGVASLDD